MKDATAIQTYTALRTVTDRHLVTALTTLTVLERAAIAKAIAALAEFDRRRLYLPLGFTSVFSFCTNKLRLSQDEALQRIAAARIAQAYPAVLEYLERNAITLTTARLLGPHLTAENHRALLESASHQKQPEVAMLIARLKPKPDVPSTIRKLPDVQPPRAAADAAPVAVATETGPSGGANSPPSRHTTRLLAASAQHVGESAQASETPARLRAVEASRLLHKGVPERRAIVAPLSETSYRLQVTMNRDTHDTLREIQALARHVIPNGDPALIVQRAFAYYLLHLKKRKTAHLTRPSAAAAGEMSAGRRASAGRGRYIPARVRRAVWARDGGQCAFVSGDGQRCEAHEFVEYHHVHPYARGGKATVRNIQLRCRAHNGHEADLVNLGGYGRTRSG